METIINSLVAYDSELDYECCDKIPTVLSSNPCQYEKRLRKIVLDLYSDRDSFLVKKGLEDMESMEQNTRVPISSAVPTPSYEIIKQQSEIDDLLGSSSHGCYMTDDVKSPAILYRYEETALTTKGSDYNMGDQTHNISPLSMDTIPYLVDRNMMGASVVQHASNMHVQQRLQGIDEDMLRFQDVSTDAAFLARSFSDSGIQLELELDERSTSTSSCEPFNLRNDTTQRDSGQSIKSHEPYTPTSMALVRSSSAIQTDSLQQTLQNQDELINSTTKQDFRNNMAVEEAEYKLKLVNIEGRLETLTNEYTQVLEERKELSDKLKTYEKAPTKDVEDRSPNVTQCEEQHLREKEQNLEKTITMLQRINDEKNIEVKDAEEKLNSSQLAVHNLQENLKTLEREMMSKSDSVETLSVELKKLTCALEETRGCYEKSLHENALLSSDVSTLMNAKSWLMKQLDASKESQLKLQLELSKYQSALQKQNKQVEELKCGNAKVAQKLSYTQENAIKEKASVLEHLEQLEKDLMSQDALLQKIQTEKNTMHRELTVKINALQEENNLLQNLAKSAQKISEELKTLKIDGDKKEGLLNQLVKEKEEISKQLTQSRNVNKTCEWNIQKLHLQLKANEQTLQSLAHEQEHKESIIHELQQNNAFLSESIQEAKVEKQGLDSAVQMLRIELDKVERRFRIMQKEIALKNNQLEEVTMEKDTFIDELSFLREELDSHRTIMEDLRDTIRQRDETIKDLQINMGKFQAEARILNENLKQNKLDFNEARKEMESLYEKLQTSNGILSNVEKKLYDSYSEKAMLEGELESTKQVLQNYKAEQNSLKEEMDRLQSVFQCEATRHRDEAISLKQEVGLMKGKLVEQSVQYKMNVENLQRKMVNMESAKVEENRNVKKHYDNIVREMSEKAECERKEKIQEITTLNEEKQSLEIMSREYAQRARDTATIHKDRINVLEKELQIARRAIDEQKNELGKQRMLSIELEREKGRLTGLKTSQNALREHCSKVEQLSAETALKARELQTQLDLVSLEKERGEKEASSKIGTLEMAVKTQNERIEELRSYLVSEKRNSSQLKVKLNTSEQEAERILKKLTKTCIELENANSSYENCAKELQASKLQERDCQERLQTITMLVQKRENDMKLLTEQENVKGNILRSLEWKTNHQSKEIEYAKEQLRLSNERHQSEIETLKTAIQVASSEAGYLRKQVTIARNAKTENQEKYFTTKDELVAAKQETEVTKQNLFAATQQLRFLKSAILNSVDVAELQEFVKHEDDTSLVTKVTFTEPTNDSEFKSSLNSLRKCMTSLRNQISTLQEQITNHTSMISSNESSWKSFEKNVQTLQLECAAVQRKAHLLSSDKEDGK